MIKRMIFRYTSPRYNKRNAMYKQLKTVQLQLDEITRRYMIFMTLLPVGLFITDRDGNVIEANPKYFDMTGLSKEDLKQGKWLDYIHPQDKIRVINEWENADSKKGFFSMKYRYYHPKKNLIWVSVHASTLKDKDGNVLGSVGLIEDVTKKQIEDKNIENKKNNLLQASLLNTSWSMISI